MRFWPWSFLYLAAIGLGAITEAFQVRSPVMSLAMTYAVLAPYLFIALRRVYRDTVVRTVLKMLVIFAVTFVVDSLTNVGALILTVWLV